MSVDVPQGPALGAELSAVTPRLGFLGTPGTAIMGAVGGAAVTAAWPHLAPAVVGWDTLICGACVVVSSRRLGDLRRQARVREREALHDPVTDLPNRTLFHQLARRALAADERRGRMSALMLLDLDRFKEINDTLGHHQGDLLLFEVASRLSAAVRAGDLVARLGGDEFAIVAIDLESAEEAILLAHRLREQVSRTAELSGIAVEVETSIGVAICSEPDVERDSEQLLCHADMAMYRAKRGHTGVELYAPEIDETSRSRLGLIAELRTGITAGQLVVHYQPKAATLTGEVIGIEALVRWQHPTLGLLYPDHFIPLAENTGLMRPLLGVVLDAALAQCGRWRDNGHADLSVAVNLSTRNLLDRALPGEVAERLALHGLPPSALELEITETTLMVDPVRAKAVLEELSALGVGLAIDDFGTGYTSLSWLGELPVTTLKIDKSFVLQMSARPQDEAIVRSSVQLGANLSLAVVAEGVEDAHAWDALARLGCDYVQGYLLSRPQPAEVLDTWLAERVIGRPRLDGVQGEPAVSRSNSVLPPPPTPG